MSLPDDFEIRVGDAMEELERLPDESVQMCVCSPPYWGLRDYGVDGQLGLEPTPEEYVENLVEVFREVRRVLAEDGTLWLNLGDSYAGSWGAQGRDGELSERSHISEQQIAAAARQESGTGSTAQLDLKPKDMVGIPWRVAFALQQPYKDHLIGAEADRAWLAGLIDADGSMGIRRQKHSGNRSDSWNPTFIPYLSVKMSDESAIRRAARVTGVGNPRKREASGKEDGRGVRTNRDRWIWRLDGNKAVRVIRDIYRHLTIKRAQAAVIHTLDLSNKSGHRGKGNKVPDDVIQKRQTLYELVKSLNQREAPDIPSFVEEPEVQTEPGFWLRSDIIWRKPNPMPESVTDRPTSSHEHIFLLAKSERYYYDHEAIKEDANCAGQQVTYGPDSKNKRAGDEVNDRRTLIERDIEVGSKRNKRDVWEVTTKPYPDAHFAVYPPDLIVPCVKAGSYTDDLVLDPFAGAGTTGVVCTELGRRFIGIELNDEYAEMARERIMDTNPTLFRETA